MYKETIVSYETSARNKWGERVTIRAQDVRITGNWRMSPVPARRRIYIDGIPGAQTETYMDTLVEMEIDYTRVKEDIPNPEYKRTWFFQSPIPRFLPPQEVVTTYWVSSDGVNVETEWVPEYKEFTCETENETNMD